MSNNTTLLPWSWSVTSNDASKCPSSSAILLTFAVVNIVVTAVGIVTGNSIFVKFITCGRFGHDGSGAWKWLWLIPFGLQMGANAGIGVLISHVPGYTSTFKVWQLIFLYTARPRLSWVVLGFLSLKSRRNVPQYRPHDRDGYWQDYSGSPKNIFDVSTLPPEHVHLDSGPSYWHSSAMAQLLAEMMLELLALYIMGRVVHFGALHKFYALSTPEYKALPRAAHLMYAGAMWYLIAVSGMLTVVIIAWYYIVEIGRKSYQSQQTTIGLMLFFGATSTWVSSWLFWAGYVELAGHS
jgi:hypothetical protein